MGYGTSEKGYKVFDPITKRIILSRDVVFDENASWDWNASSQKYFNVRITADIAKIEPTQGLEDQ